MKLRFCFSVIILGLISLTLTADDLPDAPKDLLDSTIKECKEYAAEDGIEQEKMKIYLLECVNSELEDQGYKKLDKLEE
jgi:hypothetical protein